MRRLKDERGLSLIEVLGALAIFGFVAILLSSVLFSISKASTIQGQQVEFQQTANMMIAKIEKISRTPEVYKDANYFGKYNGKINWKETHIIRLTKGDLTDSEVNKPLEDGVNPLYITDINDTLNQKSDSYGIKDQKIKIKVLLQKNENDQRKTSYGTSNYRDTFTIQTSGIILFYEDSINFAALYDSEGTWDIKTLLEDNNGKIRYSRQFVCSYRDDQKAKGEAPGNGRW